MSTTVQPFAFASSHALSSLPDLRRAVVGIFARGIGVVHDAGEARAASRHGPLQHLLVAVGIAEREDRAAADEHVDADRLARAVVDELDLGELHQRRLARGVEPELRDAGRADHLLGRNAVGLLRPHPHELDAAAGHDEGLEAVGAQVSQQLDHRLVDQLVVGPVEARMSCGREPVGNGLCEFVRRHAAMRRGHQRQQALFALRRQRLPVAGKERLERLLLLSIPDAVGAIALTRSSANAAWK